MHDRRGELLMRGHFGVCVQQRNRWSFGDGVAKDAAGVGFGLHLMWTQYQEHPHE